MRYYITLTRGRFSEGQGVFETTRLGAMCRARKLATARGPGWIGWFSAVNLPIGEIAGREGESLKKREQQKEAYSLRLAAWHRGLSKGPK